MITYSYTTRKNIATLVAIGLCVPIMVLLLMTMHIHIIMNKGLLDREKQRNCCWPKNSKKAKQQLAKQLLKSKPNVFDTVWSKNSIISRFEKGELQINDLITKCSRTVSRYLVILVWTTSDSGE